MRLLVHGGIGYYERQRIGDWPDSILRGTLEDRYRLSRNSFAFGMGTHDREVFLIARTLVSYGQRPYAVSILIDPGLDVWREYEWNAAHLALSLFHNGDAPGHVLVTDAESIRTEENVENLFASLKKAPLQELLPNDTFLNFWVGATTEHIEEQIVLMPSCVEYSMQPDIATVAAQLAHLPQCFRANLGWLIGGSKTHGKVFGSHVVFDDGPDLASDTLNTGVIKSCIEYGGRLLFACREVATRSDLQEAWKEEEQTPIWLWTDESVNPPTQLFDDLILLAEMLRVTKAPDDSQIDEVIEDVSSRLKRTGPCDEQIKSLAAEMSCSLPEPMRPERTRFVLSLWIDQQMEIGEEASRLLHPETVADDFASRLSTEALKGDTRAALLRRIHQLPLQVRSLIWQRFILSLSDADDIFQTFIDAVNDVGIDRSAAADREIEEVFRCSLSWYAKWGFSLFVWLPLQNEPRAWTIVKPLLREESRKQAKAREGDWASAYIAFGADPGGLRLCEDDTGVSEKDAEEVAERLRAIYKKGNQDAVAENWLNELARSPLRRLIRIGKKEFILRQVSAAPGWRDFQALWVAYHGDEPPKTKQPDPTELEFLRAELGQLVEVDKDCHHIDHVPNLSALSRMLGGDAALEVLCDLEPKLDWGAKSKGWLRFWKRVKPEVFSRDLLRTITEHEAQLPSEFSSDLLGLDDDSLVELFNELLCGGTKQDDKHRPRRIGEVLEIADREHKLRRALEDAFRACSRNDQKRAVLGRRLENDWAADLLFKALPDLKTEINEVIHARNNHVAQSRVEQLLTLFCSGEENVDQEYRKRFKDLSGKHGKEQRFRAAVELAFAKVETRDEFSKRTFARRFVDDAGSFEGLKKFVPSETITKVAARYQLEEYRQNVRAALYGEDLRQEESLRSLWGLLDKTSDERFRRAFANEVNSCMSDPQTANAFCRRYAWNPSYLEKTFAAIEEELQQDIVNKLSELDPKEYENRAFDAYSVCVNNMRSPSLYNRALLYPLTTGVRKMMRVRATVAKRYYGRSGDEIENNLTHIVGGYGSSLKKNSEALSQPPRTEDTLSEGPPHSDGKRSTTSVGKKLKTLLGSLSSIAFFPRDEGNDGEGSNQPEVAPKSQNEGNDGEDSHPLEPAPKSQTADPSPQ